MPNGQMYPNVSAGNDIDSFNDWDLPHAQYSVPQILNTHVHSDASAGIGLEPLVNWNLNSMPQYLHMQQQQQQQQQQQRQNANTNMNNDLGTFNVTNPVSFPVHANTTAMGYRYPQRLHMQQQRRQNADTNTNNDLGTFNVMNPGSFPVHASATATNYEYPQYRNPAPYNHHAS